MSNKLLPWKTVPKSDFFSGFANKNLANKKQHTVSLGNIAAI